MTDDDDSGSGGSSRGEATSDARVQELEAALEAAREELRQANDKFLRERADLENMKRRNTRERADLTKFAAERIIRDVLPILDNLQRAVAHAEGGGNGAPLVEGVSMVLRSLQDTLERHGVTRVKTQGIPFDPAEHEAMAMIESAAHEPNSVIEEHQAGYRLHDRLLRPALVTVAKAPGPGGNLAKGPKGD